MDLEYTRHISSLLAHKRLLHHRLSRPSLAKQELHSNTSGCIKFRPLYFNTYWVRIFDFCLHFDGVCWWNRGVDVCYIHMLASRNKLLRKPVALSESWCARVSAALGGMNEWMNAAEFYNKPLGHYERRRILHTHTSHRKPPASRMGKWYARTHERKTAIMIIGAWVLCDAPCCYHGDPWQTIMLQILRTKINASYTLTE